MTKFAGKWVSAQERNMLLRRLIGQIDQARGLMQQSKYKEADATLVGVLGEDPGNIAAIYLRGVVAFNQDQMALARRYFEQVRALSPDHAPTLNNIAAINFRQSQHLASLTLYSLAMLAAPATKEILDNVAEALHALPEDARKSTQAQKAQRLFGEQDALLQQQMSQKGLYRWGGIWITPEQVQELRKADAEVRAKLDALQADYDKLKNRVIAIESEIQANIRVINRMQADRVGTDSQGRIFVRPYTSEYYRLQRDNEVLAAERDDLNKRLTAFTERAAEIEKQRPVPRFTGTQRMIGADGVPLTPMPKMETPPPTPPPTTYPGSF